jgi:hypothetical protein
LARELGTSHQLLQHYLGGLEKWQQEERYRVANAEIKGIRARARAENRPLTPWEEQRFRALESTAIRSFVWSSWLRQVAKFREQAKNGPLHRLEFKMLELFAKHGVPGAEELLQRRSEIGTKQKKAFAAIVKDTPRQEGEPSIAWVRRIWDECEKYETDCPTEITEELLERSSQGKPKSRKDNLPPNTSGDTKSFRFVEGDTGNSAKVEGRKAHAIV